MGSDPIYFQKMQRHSEANSSRHLDALSDALNSMSDRAKRWHSLSEIAPAMLLLSLLTLLALGYFSWLNVFAILAGAVAGFAGILGHLGLVLKNQGLQIASVPLVMISALMIPSFGNVDRGFLILNAFGAGIGVTAIVLLLVSKIVKRARFDKKE